MFVQCTVFNNLINCVWCCNRTRFVYSVYVRSVKNIHKNAGSVMCNLTLKSAMSIPDMTAECRYELVSHTAPEYPAVECTVPTG